ncbi:MAG: bifunctional phosphoribosyl-AMP cyclohydrolase/phosphoribosyl-ATP diphosphatase HisIE [Bacteroidales bacterium]|nr:bifunctional phosphoribosyl-AMP cyclohydrolase/phosphoribosyl-ATP diphosphatase HisIE [Bacteroidales bacterium]
MQIKDFNELRKSPDGLVPAIVQDSSTLKVLMMGYMNEEAYKKSLESGKVTFWSRSRQCIWTKGETSGNFLLLESMSADCDADTILVMARPEGPACHKGTTTCWGEDVPEHRGFIRELEKVIQGRYEQMPEGSYTTSLFRKGTPRMAQKVGEEAVETVIEAMKGDKERLIYEASDLIYHLLVLLTSQGLGIEDLEKELQSRHK